MLTSLRIQNFRSIRDASVKLGQVNLFIGPNNSGKSNFLKGIKLLAEVAILYPNPFDVGDYLHKQILTRNIEHEGIPTINFAVQMAGTPEPTVLLNIGYARGGVLILIDSLDEQQARWIPQIGSARSFPNAEDETMNTLRREMFYSPMYRIEPSTFLKSTGLTHQSSLSESGDNIVNFIYYLSQNHKKRFRQFEADLSKCLGNIVSVSTPVDPEVPGSLKLRFFDQNDIGYWAEEVSEGVLYFLALLCIVHQPNPPKLLLLEEPEKGIHPRRIREVMDFIFELAHLRDIQIILTSHSPYVVDYFKDIPECISIFDRDPESGETLIKNAGDYIEQSNEELVKKGFEPISYTNSLGEYWISGFLGGVPLSNL